MATPSRRSAKRRSAYPTLRARQVQGFPLGEKLGELTIVDADVAAAG
jgi:hypothetical protein